MFRERRSVGQPAWPPPAGSVRISFWRGPGVGSVDERPPSSLEQALVGAEADGEYSPSGHLGGITPALGGAQQGVPPDLLTEPAAEWLCPRAGVSREAGGVALAAGQPFARVSGAGTQRCAAPGCCRAAGDTCRRRRGWSRVVVIYRGSLRARQAGDAFPDSHIGEPCFSQPSELSLDRVGLVVAHALDCLLSARGEGGASSLRE